MHLMICDGNICLPFCVVKDYGKRSTPSTFGQELVKSIVHNRCA